MKTAVVEKDVVGGRCLNYACIPAKAVLRSADVLSEIDDAERVRARRRATVRSTSARSPSGAARSIKTLTGGVAGLFKKNAIDVHRGLREADGRRQRRRRRRLRRARAGGQDGRARHRLGRPADPRHEFGGRVIGTEGRGLMTELPDRIAVVGAGASGTEIASAYARLGTETLLFEALDRVLPTEDADISKVAERGLKKQGMTIHTGTLVEDVEAGDEVREVHLRRRQRPRSTTSSSPPAAAPDVEGLGLDEAGVELDEHGLVEVDGALKTSQGGRVRDRRPRRRPGARPQGLRRGDHRRRGRRRPADPPASSTSTSRAPRSACPTSPRSG